MSHPLDDFFSLALRSNIFPGAALLVSSGGRVLWNKVYGLAQTIPCSRKITPNTLFDLASLTKPICTATLFMLALKEKKCSLKDPIARFYSRAKSKKITLQHLLNHTSGLAAWRPYHQEFLSLEPHWVGTEQGKEWLIHKILEEPLGQTPGEKVVYSDLGYILLGNILEKIFKEPLDKLFEKRIARPLKLKNTFFNRLRPTHGSTSSPCPDLPPGAVLSLPKSQFAATEKCPWRKKILCGEVMDDHAWMMGGVAGHAGLFSTGTDILKWLNALRKGLKGTSRSFPRSLVSRFLEVPAKRNPEKPFFTLGFDTPSNNSQAGKYFSPQSVGHLGYSGTSFWWDVKKDAIVILLTNRVHPSRDNEKIREFRPKLHDLIWETLLH